MVVTNANYTAVSNDGRILAATDGTADITIIDLQQHRIISHCLPTIYDSASRVYSFFELNIPMMCLNDDGTILAFSHGRNITLWNCQTGKLITRLTLDTEAASYVFVPGTTNLLIITADGILHTLDCKSFTWSKSHYIGGAVYCLVPITDINRLAGYTDADTIVLINPDDYSYNTYSTVDSGPSSNIISGWGSWIGYDKRLNKIVALMPLDSLAYWKWPSMQLISKDDSEHNIGCISSKGTMVTEDHPGCPVICDINKKPILKLTEPDFSYGSCFSASGDFAVMNYADHTRIDLRNNKVLKSVFPDRGSILSPMTYVETSLHKGIAKNSPEVMPHIYSSGLPDSLTVFAGKYRLYQQNDGPLMLEVASTGKLLGKYPSIEEETSRCSISMSNDARLVSILSNNSISVRQVKSTEYLKLPDFRAEVFLGEMSPDGKLLAVGSFDYPAPPIDDYDRGSTIFITAPGSKKVICKLFPHQGYVISARFSKDGSRIVTIDEANTLRMWNSKTGKLLYARPSAGTTVFFNNSNTKLIVWATPDAFDLLDAKNGRFLARTWRYQLGINATISVDGFYDGDKESCCSTEWSMDGGQMSTLAKSKLKHQSGLWEALAK